MAGQLVSLSTVATNLKETLETIVDDNTDGLANGLVMAKYFKVGSMSDRYEDDLEMSGTGLASEKEEGEELTLGSIQEGRLFRYWARTYGLKLIVTEEAREDSKYPEVIKAAKRIKRSMYKTVEYDAASVPARGWNSSYTYGGEQLFSSTHSIPTGGSFSNDMAIPMSPSRQCISVARSMALRMPGHDGFVEGYQLRAVMYPPEQHFSWSGVLRSDKAPEPGAFNEINVAAEMGIELIENKYWTTTTTASIFLTDCDNGLQWKWRRKPRPKTWQDQDHEVEKFGISARWARGISDFRALIGNNA